MLEYVFRGGRRYWTWVLFLLLLIGAGAAAYAVQFRQGLGVTGLSREVSWGLYIGQFTFLVGVAASAVMVVLPYHFHKMKDFGKILVFGEFVAVAAVVTALLFIIVDLGKPQRLFNLILHPTPHSLMFWDMVVLSVYLLLNLISGWHLLEAENKGVHPPAWVERLPYVSVPWAVSIHTVTAFLYAGLAGRHYWLSALAGARFLASAFAAGPALLIALAFVLRRFARVDVGREAVRRLTTVTTYATVTSIFFVLLELFTAFYSGIESHAHGLVYLFGGIAGHREMAPLMWLFAVLLPAGAALLLNPRSRQDDRLLLAACGAVFVSLWIEKGIGWVVGGFVPDTFARVTPYVPTATEVLITLGVWAVGALVLTVLCRLAVCVRHSAE